MSFNVSKCCILSIHHKSTPPALNYILGNTLLNVVKTHSYLGATVSSDLRWHEHVNNVSAKATKTLNFIRRNVYWCPPDTKATSYVSLVPPHLEYAAAAWDPYLVGDCKQLEKVQHLAAHFVKRDYRSTTSVSLLISQLVWQTLSDRSRNSRLSLMYKSLHGLAGISTSPFHRSSKPTRSADGWCTPSILVPLLTGMPSRYMWSLVLPFIRSAVPYIPAWPTLSNHSPIPAD